MTRILFNAMALSLPIRVKWLIVQLVPFVALLEICYWVLLLLQLLHFPHLVNLDLQFMEGDIAHYAFTVFMLVSITSCMVFTSYANCALSMGYIPPYHSPVPIEYTIFVHYLLTGCLPVVVILKILGLPGLFTRSRYGWNLLLLSSALLSILFLVSLNVVAFIVYALLLFYLHVQLKEVYR